MVIAVSVVYYLLKYIPEQNERTLKISLQKQCLELGSKREKEDQTYNKQNTSNDIVSSSDYIFDKNTNDCLYRSISVGQGITQKSIVDLFTNKTLGYYMENIDGRIVGGDKGEFNYVQHTHFGTR